MSEFEKPQFITQLADDITNGTKTANIIGTVLLHPDEEQKKQIIKYIRDDGRRNLTNTTEGCKNLIFTEAEFNSLEPIQKSRAMALCKVLLSIAANSDIVDELKPILDDRIAGENKKNIDQRLSEIQNNLAALENSKQECSDEDKKTVINEYINFLEVIDDITKTVDSVSDGAEQIICDTVDAATSVAAAGVKKTCKIAKKAATTASESATTAVEATTAAVSFTDYIGGTVINKLYNIIGQFDVIECYNGISELSKSIVGETYNKIIMTAFHGYVASFTAGKVIDNLDYVLQIIQNLLNLAQDASANVAWGGIFLTIGLGLNVLLKASTKITSDLTVKINELIKLINDKTNNVLALSNEEATEILYELFTAASDGKRKAEGPAVREEPPAADAADAAQGPPAENQGNVSDTGPLPTGVLPGGKRKTKKNKKKMTKSKKHFKKQSRKILKKLSKKKNGKKH
jgi:hypothetical protein